jgi:hypothetical protein
LGPSRLKPACSAERARRLHRRPAQAGRQLRVPGVMSARGVPRMTSFSLWNAAETAQLRGQQLPFGDFVRNWRLTKHRPDTSCDLAECRDRRILIGRRRTVWHRSTTSATTAHAHGSGHAGAIQRIARQGPISSIFAYANSDELTNDETAVKNAPAHGAALGGVRSGEACGRAGRATGGTTCVSDTSLPH